MGGFNNPKDKELLDKLITEQIGVEGWQVRREGVRERKIPKASSLSSTAVTSSTSLQESDGEGLAYEAKGESSQLQPGQGTMKNLKDESRR